MRIAKMPHMEWHRPKHRQTRRVTIRVPTHARPYLPGEYSGNANLTHDTGARTIAEGNVLGASWVELFLKLRDEAIEAAEGPRQRFEIREADRPPDA
jgi:hypothetical protein